MDRKTLSPSSPRAVLRLALCAVALGLAAPAIAESPEPAAEPAARPSGAAGERAVTLLDAIAKRQPAAGRLEAAAALAELGADAIPELQAFLARQRRSTEANRREVLRAIKADVPTKDGRFRPPGRGQEKVNMGDDFDWLAALVELDHRAGLGEVIADVAALRALAASKSSTGAAAILDFGFTDDGLVYRDECGRQLRKMAPYSLPVLIAASQNNKEKARSLQRYANYQLDRIDRQDPNKAINAASLDPELEVEVIRAYGSSKHREAIVPLLDHINDGSPPIRAAARQALLGYLTGPPPPEAPKRKLVMPGGKLSNEPQPLWLNYRELADVELRREHQEIFGERAPRKSTPEELARKLFAHYDEKRAQAAAKAYDEGAALAAAGNWAEATAIFDRLLAARPDHPARADMARAYFEHAGALASAGSFRDAAVAYSKAHGLDPDAPSAPDALAGHYTALGKALQAQGKDGSAAFKHALAVQPTHEDARRAHDEHRGNTRPAWMLYAGLSGGAGALILLILGFAIRRR
jgi:tetratricopeptide (TPR) repeat protein